jgi:hypothetical protein
VRQFWAIPTVPDKLRAIAALREVNRQLNDRPLAKRFLHVTELDRTVDSQHALTTYAVNGGHAQAVSQYVGRAKAVRMNDEVIKIMLFSEF